MHGFAACADVPPLACQPVTVGRGGGAAGPSEEDSDATVRASRLPADRWPWPASRPRSCCPAALRPRRGPRRPQGGHHPGPRLAEPVQHACSSSGTRSSAHLQLADRLRAEPRAGPRLRRHVGARRGRQVVDLPHPRRHEVVGRPARDSADACFSWQLDLDAIKADGETSASATSTRRSRTPASRRSTAPDPTTMIVDHGRPVRPRSSRPAIADHAQARLGQGDLQDDRRLPSSTGRSSARDRTRSANGRPASSSRFVRNPNYWGKQGYPDEIDIQYLQGRSGHDGPGAQGRRARLRPRPERHQFNQLKTTRTSRPWPARPTAGASSASTATGRHRQDDPGGGPSTKALLDPAFRDALGYAIDKRPWSTEVLGGYGDARHDASAAGPRQLARRADHAAHLRHRRRPSRSSTRPATRSTPTDTPRQGGQADQPADVHARLRPELPEGGQFIQDWFGQLGIKVTQQVRRGTLARQDAPAGSR